ncbi:ABC-three component system protein [Lactobacillus johnsonii]|uniref:ABC-three component system protein n=1 Tax=Lactobacillus johnsonii TaxID=33959 RepID=UPI003D77D03B
MTESHQASQQMLGYLYQVVYALYLIISCEDNNDQIGIERFDDVSFEKNGTPKELIQLKHHVIPGKLTDSSIDLWRTLKVWMDSRDILENDTKLLLITTASAPEGSVAYLLKANEQIRDYQSAYYKLMEVAKKSKNKAILNACNTFKKLDQSEGLKFVKRIIVLDGATDITDTDSKIKSYLEIAVKPKYEDEVLTDLKGWWFQQCVLGLCSSDLKLISKIEVTSEIRRLVKKYDIDYLPIASDIYSLKYAVKKDSTYVKQLGLLKINDEEILESAASDYVRADTQRSKWIREDPSLVNEFDEYDRNLIDRWHHLFITMKMELAEDPDKIKAGRRLYGKIMNQDFPIRADRRDHFIMCGSYQKLSDNLKIGWHKDYHKLLKGSEYRNEKME